MDKSEKIIVRAVAFPASIMMRRRYRSTRFVTAGALPCGRRADANKATASNHLAPRLGRRSKTSSASRADPRLHKQQSKVLSPGTTAPAAGFVDNMSGAMSQAISATEMSLNRISLRGIPMSLDVQFLKEHVMNSNRYSVMESVLLAAALAAGVSGVASAGDMSRISGDSYAYFASQPIDKSPSAWRRGNPGGVSERALQAQSASSASPVWQLDKPVFNVASDPTFKQTHPNGLSEHELQALSSDAPAWHQNVSRATATASNDRTNFAPQTFAASVARFFGSSR